MIFLAYAGCCPWSLGSKYAKIPKFGYDLGYHATENVPYYSEITRFDGSEDLEKLIFESKDIFGMHTT